RGAEGAVGFSSGGRVQVAPVVVDAVDTVGAGDTFSAGILDALAARGLLGAAQREELHAMPADDVATVLRRASGLAAITVSRAGANPPWSHELTLVGHRPLIRTDHETRSEGGIVMSESTPTAEQDGYRIEHDTMGEVRVPASALYRAQTQRAVENFPISGQGLEPAHVHALAQVKKAAARANAELGELDPAISEAIVTAADQVIAGDHDDQFPVDTYQTGSGTSSNMNMNEVLATIASRAAGTEVHPNDHVNASQSSNDVFPTSVHVAVTAAVVEKLLPSLTHRAATLETKAEAWQEVVKAGRTHLMDATPVTLGQEFGGFAAQLRYGIERVEAAL